MTATKITTTPATAALLGDVATTTVQGSCTSCQMATNGLFPIGENIYGPYEAGFAAQQDFILEGLGCSPGSLGRLAGGIDTKTAEAMVAYQCNITLPRYDDGSYVSLLVIAPHLSVISSRISNHIHLSTIPVIHWYSLAFIATLSCIGNTSPPHSSVTFPSCIENPSQIW